MNCLGRKRKRAKMACGKATLLTVPSMSLGKTTLKPYLVVFKHYEPIASAKKQLPECASLLTTKRSWFLRLIISFCLVEIPSFLGNYLGFLRTSCFQPVMLHCQGKLYE